jgi:hypothetical protein
MFGSEKRENHQLSFMGIKSRVEKCANTFHKPWGKNIIFYWELFFSQIFGFFGQRKVNVPHWESVSPTFPILI